MIFKMRSTFLGFETARKSVMASQKALDITGNNLSNVNTKGYTRQRLDLFSVVTPSSGRYSSSSVSASGQGVLAAGVDQIRDPYLDKKYRELNSEAVDAGVRKSILGDVENVLDNIDTEAISKALDNFKTSLSSYATNAPDLGEIAATVRSSASQIVNILNDYDSRLEVISNQTKDEIDGEIGDLNATLTKIADLNKQIKDAYVSSGEISMSAVGDYTVNTKYGPNELLDTRNVLLDSLSNYGEIDVQNENDGTVTVNMSGVEVVSDVKAAQLTYTEDSYGAITMIFSNGSEYKPNAGELSGYVDIYNGNGCYAQGAQIGDKGIPYFRTTIDQFANVFATAMNNANVDSADPTVARPMFSSSDGSQVTAGNIRISDEWMNDPEALIPASQDGTLDNAHLMKLLSVFDADNSFGDKDEFKGTFNKYVSYYTNELSQEIKYQGGRSDTITTLASNALDSRDEVSGVSMEEEGINMMNYQKWFNASARLMTTLDEELDKIINEMGLVGR